MWCKGDSTEATFQGVHIPGRDIEMRTYEALSMRDKHYSHRMRVS